MVAAACGDDVSSADSDTSSTGMAASEDPDSSGTESPSPTMSSTADDSSSGTESSTGDDVPMPTDARVFYTITQGTEEQNGTWLVDVVAGALGEPTRVDEDVAYPVSASPSGRWMVDGGPGGLPGMPIHVVGQSRWPNGQACPASTKLAESGHISG